MTRIRYFADLATGTVELTNIRFECHDDYTDEHHYFGTAPDGTTVQATRIEWIEDSST